MTLLKRTVEQLDRIDQFMLDVEEMSLEDLDHYVEDLREQISENRYKAFEDVPENFDGYWIENAGLQALLEVASMVALYERRGRE